MNLTEIESILAYYRKDLAIKLVKGKKNSLQLPVLEKIENGENYNLPSLMAYIKAIGMDLSVNDVVISNTEELGAFLKKEREFCGQTLADVRSENNRGNRETNKLEAGGGSRNNLLKYLEKLNKKIDFKMIDKYGIAKEKESEKNN